MNFNYEKPEAKPLLEISNEFAMKKGLEAWANDKNNHCNDKKHIIKIFSKALTENSTKLAIFSKKINIVPIQIGLLTNLTFIDFIPK